MTALRPFALLAPLALALTLPLSALAQDSTPAPAPETPPPAGQDFSTGESVPAEGEESPIYVAETQGDWEIRCVRAPDGFDPCQVYQLLKDQNGTSVAEFTLVSLPSGGEAAAGATVLTPLETLLTQQLTVSVDAGQAKRYPFTWCDRFGCYARIGFTQAEVDQLKRGKAAQVVIVPMMAPDQRVNLAVSLSGFTKAFDRMRQMNEDSAAKRQAATASGGGTTPPAGGN